jgi:hypothetical protein
MIDERSDDSTAAAATMERRHSPRFSPTRRVTVTCVEGVMSPFGWGESHADSAILDLSSGGARLETRAPLEAGAVLCLEIGLNGIEGIEAYGEVRWSRSGSGAGFQAGIEFFHVPSAQLKELRIFLEGLQTAP